MQSATTGDRRSLWALRTVGLRTLGLFGALLLSPLVSGCVMVRPEQRAILADRIMQFGSNGRSRAALQHALENREGSAGGGTVEGGGCGCN